MLKIHYVPMTRAMRVVWLCEEMGVPYQVAPVSFPDVGDAYRALNPIGAVPFIEDDGGVAINESVAIMLYIAQRYGPTPLLPKSDDPALARVLQFAVFGEASIGSWINTLLMSRFGAPDDQKDNWSVGAATAQLDKAVNYVGTALGGADYIAGPAFTLADISISHSLMICTMILGTALPQNLQSYQARISTRPAFGKAMAVR